MLVDLVDFIIVFFDSHEMRAKTRSKLLTKMKISANSSSLSHSRKERIVVCIILPCSSNTLNICKSCGLHKITTSDYIYIYHVFQPNRKAYLDKSNFEQIYALYMINVCLNCLCGLIGL